MHNLLRRIYNLQFPIYNFQHKALTHATFLLVFVISYLVFGIPAAHAAGEFSTSYKVRYDVNDTGGTTVSQNITLRNNTTNFYADKFELKIGSTKVENVKASDSAGPLQIDTKFENNVTTIAVKFNQKVIGIDKTLPWTLSYSSNELASRSGQIWEVSIPRLAKSQDIENYSATVSMPVSFGPIAFAVPDPQTSNKLGSIQEFTYSKDQLEKSGIAMSFGTKQVFGFTLNYYLDNPNLTARIEQITLPPDTDYQKVVLEKIEPRPFNVTVDSDNNFIGQYQLAPKESIKIKATGYVEVFSRPFRNIYRPLTPAQKTTYTAGQKYWEIDNQFIKQKAAELKTPRAIYDFVSSYLSYNENRLNQARIDRKGAAAAVLSPKDSVCMEFTDLFIAIARAAGIPAREVEGYAYTQNTRLRPLSLELANGDVLHAWPEYWDKELGWVQIDPTWGTTSGGLDYFDKLDFNHITFIQRGESSTYPYPAGSYKKDGEQSKKDLFVDFAVELPTVTSTPSLGLTVPDKILAGIPVKITALARNIGTSSIINQTLTIDAGKLKKSGQIENPQQIKGHLLENEINILPPFGQQEFEVSLQGTNIWQKINDVITVNYFTSQIAQPVEIIPVYSVLFLKSFLIVLGLAMTLIVLGLLLYKKFVSKKHIKLSD